MQSDFLVIPEFGCSLFKHLDGMMVCPVGITTSPNYWDRGKMPF